MGSASVLLHIPHSSLVIPDGEKGSFLIDRSELEKELLLLTDRYTDELFDGLEGKADRLLFPVSRLVVDPERFRDDSAEPMAARGMGAVYTQTHDGHVLRTVPDREATLQRWYDPHHEALNAWTTGSLAEYGHALVIDCHSFPSTPLACDLDQRPDRPDACVGTDDTHTPAWLIEAARSALASQGWTVEVDRPYAGTMVPSSFRGEDARVHSVMIEVNRRLYMDERTGAKLAAFDDVKGRIRDVLGKVVAEWERQGNPEGSFKVKVDDNFHHMDEQERYTAGTFGTYEEALAKAKEILGWSLDDAGYEYGSYTMFGDDPWILPSPERRQFSAWDCARFRCEGAAVRD